MDIIVSQDREFTGNFTEEEYKNLDSVRSTKGGDLLISGPDVSAAWAPGAWRGYQVMAD